MQGRWRKHFSGGAFSTPNEFKSIGVNYRGSEMPSNEVIRHLAMLSYIRRGIRGQKNANGIMPLVTGVGKGARSTGNRQLKHLLKF